jgi:hypothetical protein
MNTEEAPRPYRVVVRGELGDQFGVLFDGMRVSRERGNTVLTGRVSDQAHLAGIIARTQDLGLELVSVAQLDNVPGGTSTGPG